MARGLMSHTSASLDALRMSSYKKTNRNTALQPHSRSCISVGYVAQNPCWKIYDPASRTFLDSSQAVFDERYLPGTLLLRLPPIEKVNADSKKTTSDDNSPGGGTSTGLEGVLGAPFDTISSTAIPETPSNISGTVWRILPAQRARPGNPREPDLRVNSILSKSANFNCCSLNDASRIISC